MALPPFANRISHEAGSPGRDEVDLAIVDTEINLNINEELSDDFIQEVAYANLVLLTAEAELNFQSFLQPN